MVNPFECLNNMTPDEKERLRKRIEEAAFFQGIPEDQLDKAGVLL